VSANRHLDRYREFDVDAVLSDRRADFQGPLAGIEAAADSVSGDVLLLLPCDLPRLAATVPALLLKQLQDQPEADAVYAQTADRAHYLCAALRRRCLDSLSEHLDAGERSMRGWYRSINALPRYFGEEESGGFRNFNSSEDFRG
jgi:molybdopterin-guanine dinucleotide biosynthesis protein A